MGLLSYLRGTDLVESTSTIEARSLPPAENQLPLLGAYTASTVTPAKALAIGDVWAAVRVLADSVSSLPLHVYRKGDAGRAPTGTQERPPAERGGDGPAARRMQRLLATSTPR